MKYEDDLKKYIYDYNEVLSIAANELDGKFSGIASPTLNKQETVSHLYNNIIQEHCYGYKQPFPWKQLFTFVPRLVITFAKLCYASIKFRVKSIPENSVCFRSWLEPKCVQGNVVIDEHFRSIPNDLSLREDVVVLLQPYDYSLLKKFNELDKMEGCHVAVGLLHVMDIVVLMFKYVFTAYANLKGRYYYEGNDISKNINRSLLIDYLSMRSFMAYLDRHICLKLIDFSPKAFVYVYENQSWEKACCQVLRSRGVKLVGCQGSGFSPFFLNFFPTKMDSRKQFTPDVILTVGDYFTKYLVQNGNYEVPIKTFAAVRFSYPNDGARYIVKSPIQKVLNKILYAFPVHVSQYSEIISDLISVFGDTDISVDLKLHPQYVRNKYAGGIPSNFSFVSDVDTLQLAQNYDCVLFNDNSYGIEAMIAGVKSYQYNKYGKFFDERLFYFDLWETHLDYDKLILLRDEMLSGNIDKLYDVSAVEDYINSMYRPYDYKSLSLMI